MIQKRTAERIRRELKAIDEYLNGRNSYTKKELRENGIKYVSNDDRAKLEIYEFCKDKPKQYFAYLTKKDGQSYITNWTGEKLAKCYVYNISKSNFRDIRYYFQTYKAINGLIYYGIGYGGYGMYVRMRAYKDQNNIPD